MFSSGHHLWVFFYPTSQFIGISVHQNHSTVFIEHVSDSRSSLSPSNTTETPHLCTQGLLRLFRLRQTGRSSKVPPCVTDTQAYLGRCCQYRVLVVWFCCLSHLCTLKTYMPQHFASNRSINKIIFFQSGDRRNCFTHHDCGFYASSF